MKRVSESVRGLKIDFKGGGRNKKNKSNEAKRPEEPEVFNRKKFQGQ